MNESPPVPRDHLLQAIRLKIRDMMAASHRLGPEPLLDLDLDLTMKQLKVLLCLGGMGPSRPGVIASTIGGSAATATGVVDRLVALGCVERTPDPADRRALLIRLTAAGTQIVEDLQTAGEQRLALALVEMADQDLEALHRGLAALVSATQRLPQLLPFGGRATAPGIED
ncbi:MAG: MarR family transcriptional regulator [Dehalococcoidia bacterium]